MLHQRFRWITQMDPLILPSAVREKGIFNTPQLGAALQDPYLLDHSCPINLLWSPLYGKLSELSASAPTPFSHIVFLPDCRSIFLEPAVLQRAAGTKQLLDFCFLTPYEDGCPVDLCTMSINRWTAVC